jgi:uncharacterized repeat protein (TIGR02543 family)
MKKFMTACRVLLSAATVVFLASCGGGGGGGNNVQPQVQPPAANLTGTWSWSGYVASTSCAGASVTPWAGVVNHQSGSNDFTITSTTTGVNIISAQGTISGSSVSLTASYPDNGGTTNFSYTGTLDSTNMIIDGTSTWNWNGSQACSGTAHITATCTTCSSGGSTYTVTYNGNGNTGGSAPVDTTNYQSGHTVTVLGNTGNLVKTGYPFAGWNTLANGSGTTYTQGQTFIMGSANVTLYAKWTMNATYTVGGTVSGLSGAGLVLQNNGGDNLAISANGSFTFATEIADGGGYNVTIKTQPSNPLQTCTASSNAGVVAGAGVTSVHIVCSTNTYSVGGTVSGLSGAGLVLQNNSGDNHAASANGSFTFAAKVADGGGYFVTIKTQPSNPLQTCTASNNAGVIAGADVTSVHIVCSTNTYSVGGTVSGLSGLGLVLQDNGGDNHAVTANGPFTFATKVADGGGYNVTVSTQPSNPSQICTASYNTGHIAGANVTNVHVTCALSYTVTYNGNHNTSGNVPIGPTAYTPGQTVTVLGNSGSLSDISFAWSTWNTQANGSGTSYSAGSSFTMPAANVTLYAQWNCLTYSPAGAYTTDMIALAGCNIRVTEGQNLIAPMLITPNGDCALHLADNQLWITQGGPYGTEIWQDVFNACQNSGGCYWTFQSDGNLVVYDPNNNPVWASNTSGHPGAVLYMSPGVNTSGQTSCRITIFDNNTSIFLVP